MASQDKRCGFVALLGRPNAGKSTLLNACIRQKIAGVSRKPQMTRHRILGIRTEGAHQLLFHDTPGLNLGSQKRGLDKILNKTALSAVSEADTICYLIDPLKGFTEDDQPMLEILGQCQEQKVYFVLSKIDRLKNSLVKKCQETLQQQLLQAGEKGIMPVQPQILLVSSKQKESVEVFCQEIAQSLPQQEWFYGPDDLTDKSEKFLLAEMIREQVFRQLGQELPFGSDVLIERIEEKKSLVKISAAISVDKPNHKGILIGKGGNLLKTIGSDARKALETYYDQKVFLELFVKVVSRRDWEKRLLKECETAY